MCYYVLAMYFMSYHFTRGHTFQLLKPTPDVVAAKFHFQDNSLMIGTVYLLTYIVNGTSLNHFKIITEVVN